jgi:hypothetical protein
MASRFKKFCFSVNAITLNVMHKHHLLELFTSMLHYNVFSIQKGIIRFMSYRVDCSVPLWHIG